MSSFRVHGQANESPQSAGDQLGAGTQGSNSLRSRLRRQAKRINDRIAGRDKESGQAGSSALSATEEPSYPDSFNADQITDNMSASMPSTAKPRIKLDKYRSEVYHRCKESELNPSNLESASVWDIYKAAVNLNILTRDPLDFQAIHKPTDFYNRINAEVEDSGNLRSELTEWYRKCHSNAIDFSQVEPMSKEDIRPPVVMMFNNTRGSSAA